MNRIAESGMFLATVCMVGHTASATLLNNDTFDVGPSITVGDDAGDPSDFRFYSNGYTALGIADDSAGIGSGNAMNVDNFIAFGRASTNFNTVSLDQVGQGLALTFDVRRLTSTTPAGSAPSFRFGLYDGGGTPVVATNLGGTSNATSDDNGYFIQLGVNSQGALALRETAESNGILGGPATPAAINFGNGTGADYDGLNDTAAHHVELTLSRVSQGIQIRASVDGTVVVDVTDTGLNPNTNQDEGLFISQFDVLGFGIGSTGVIYDYRLDNINLTLVPEPSSLALLGLSGLVLCRRRRH